ncbi:MAG: hypothetical protein ACM3SW_10135 [Actinomycetota bacterium]
MKQDNRVLARLQARELTDVEKQIVMGGISTKTLCTIGVGSARDGDTFLGEC